MSKITHEEYEKAQSLIRRYEYQQNPEIQISISYNAEVSISVVASANKSVEEIYEDLKDGYWHVYQRDAEDDIEYIKMTEMIVNGEYVDIKKLKKKSKKVEG